MSNPLYGGGGRGGVAFRFRSAVMLVLFSLGAALRVRVHKILSH